MFLFWHLAEGDGVRLDIVAGVIEQGNPYGALWETVPDPHERRDGRARDEADQRLC